MPASGGAAPLTLVVVGGDSDLDDWRAALDGRTLRVRAVTDEDGSAADEGSSLEARLVRLEGLRGPFADGGFAVLAISRRAGGVDSATDTVAAIAHAKREWESALDAVSEGVVLLDGQGIVLRANRAFSELVGRTFARIVGQPLVELVGEPSSPEGSDPVTLALKGARQASGEVRFAALEGVFQVAVTEISADVANQRTVVATLRDVTEVKERQQRQEVAHRLAGIGRLAGGVAHEISTPLASIALRAESLVRKCNNPELLAVPAFADFPRYLKTIEGETFRCKRIISALLDFSQPRLPAVASTDMSALVETVVALARDQARARRVSLETCLDPGVPLVPADAGQIREAVMAILLNAIDASRPDGVVTLESSREGRDFVRLTVKDSGEGIAPENLERIFVPFFTTKPVGQAVGLGLPICEGILRAHSGSIAVESAPGVGTVVTMRLPSRQAAP